MLFHSFGTSGELIREDRFDRALSLVCGALRHLRDHGIPATLLADFLAWHPQPVTNRANFASALVALARAERANDTEAHNLLPIIEAVPEDHSLLVLSDMPPDAWDHILPTRSALPGRCPPAPLRNPCPRDAAHLPRRPTLIPPPTDPSHSTLSMRTVFLVLATAAAYAFLRGWPEFLHPLMRACFAVLILVLGVGLWHRRVLSRRPRARAVRPPALSDYLAMGLGVLAIECLFLFILTAAPPKAEELATVLEETLRPELAAARKAEAEAAQAPTGSQRGNWLWDSQGRRPLPQNIAARPSNKPEVFLRPEDEETTREILHGNSYVRAFALETYSGATWSVRPIPAELLEADSGGAITIAQPEARSAPELRCEVFHAAHPGGQDVFTAPQGAREVELPRLRRIAPAIFRLDPLANPETGYNYRCVSRPLALDTLVADPDFKGLQVSGEAPEHLLALPEDQELRDSLLSIAVRTQGPLEQRLVALRSFLRQNCSYSLTVENVDQLDPLANFLFHERRGHCEFFATAGALLARCLGVPSRVAYGWTGGRFFTGQDLFMFRAKEAHAWTELYFDDVGWVLFDSTPPGALDAASRSVADPGEQAPLGEDAFLEYDPGLDGEGTLGRWPWIALAVGAGLLPLAFLLLRLRYRPPRTRDPEAARLLPDPPGYLALFRRTTARHGHPMPTARTLRQHLLHLASQDASPTFAGELLDYHYATTYGTASPDRARERALHHAIAAWRAA